MLVSWETRNIFPEVSAFTNTAGEPQPWPASFIVLAQAKDYFRKVLSDGIAILKEFFDLSSEENLLRHLPTTYEWMDKGISNTGVPGSFYEEDDGIVMCLAAIVLGDIEFVERYALFRILRSDGRFRLRSHSIPVRIIGHCAGRWTASQSGESFRRHWLWMTYSARGCERNLLE
jgi:hypothetical protein